MGAVCWLVGRAFHYEFWGLGLVSSECRVDGSVVFGLGVLSELDKGLLCLLEAWRVWHSLQGWVIDSSMWFEFRGVCPLSFDCSSFGLIVDVQGVGFGIFGVQNLGVQEL